MAYKVEIGEICGRTSKQVIHNDVAIEDGQYGQYKIVKKEWAFFPRGGAVYVEASLTDIDSCEQYLILYFDKPDNKRRIITFPRKDLTESGVVSHAPYIRHVRP